MSKIQLLNYTPRALEHIVEIARVSSTRTDKKANPGRLLRYLVKHGHWSPFEHAYVSFEITTSRAISAQLIRHRSFTFQETSQRYVDLFDLNDDIFEEVELRGQHPTNRQASVEGIQFPQDLKQRMNDIKSAAACLYSDMLSHGVAKECARMILPMCAKTTLIMTGNIRSWFHFLQGRTAEEAQKEIRMIALDIQQQLCSLYPLFQDMLQYL